MSTPSKPALWGLVDCQTFYASCERLFRPDLADKPVVVLSNNDGCLIALSPEAKALGFKMGDLFFQAEARLKKLGVAVFSSNYTLYGDLSHRVMATLATLAPEVDQYSIDEAFIPFSPAMTAQAEEVGWAMHDRVRRWVGVPVRVGIGPTRTLAKLANHWAKKMTRVLRLELESKQLETILEETPVAEVWGIGRRLSARLTVRGLTTARDLRDMDLRQAQELLSAPGQRTVLELRGIACIEDKPTPRKTLVNTRSFGRRVTEKEDLMEALALHCALAGERLRSENLTAAALAIHLETSRHLEETYFRAGATINLPAPTNVTSDFIRAARAGLNQCYQPGHDFMKGGVLLFDLQEPGRSQPSLLDVCQKADDGRSSELMTALDKINGKYGRGSLRYLAQGQPEAFWHMKRNMMSGRATTNWEELAVVKG